MSVVRQVICYEQSMVYALYQACLLAGAVDVGEGIRCCCLFLLMLWHNMTSFVLFDL